MAVTIVNGGIKTVWLNRVEDSFDAVKLFQDNETFTDSKGDSDFDVATFSGYPGIGFVSTSFSQATQDGNKAKAVTPVHTFAHDGGVTSNDIYGYYGRGDDSADNLFGAQFSGAPISMATNGDRIDLKLQLELGDYGDLIASDFIIDNALEVELNDRLAQTGTGTRSYRFRATAYTDGVIGSPSNTDVVGDYNGNTSVHIPGASNKDIQWVAGATTVGGVAEKIANTVTWALTSDISPTTETIKGVYYEWTNNNGSSWTFVGAEELPSPVTVEFAGDGFSLAPRLRVKSIN